MLAIAIFEANTLAQDTTAIQFAEDAVVALRADYHSARQRAERNVGAATELRTCHLALLDAETLLARLNKNSEAVAAKLQQALRVHSEQLVESQALAERGANTDKGLSDAKLHVLKAKLRLAKHLDDGASIDAIIRAAIELEKRALDRLIRLSKRGIGSQKDIALQKMRLAVLIANKTIVAD